MERTEKDCWTTIRTITDSKLLGRHLHKKLETVERSKQKISSTKLQVIESRLVSFYKEIFIRQNGGMVRTNFYFKKGCHTKYAIATLRKMLMNTLSESLGSYCSAIIPASFTERTLGLSYIICPAWTACQGIYQIARVACEMETNLKWLTGSLEDDR